ncbi:MAG: DsbA family protein [Candidatus Kerfeldbacteria bacterium]
MDNQDQVLTKKQRRELKRQGKIENRKKNDSKKKIIRYTTWAIIIIIVIGGIYWLSQGDGDNTSTTTVNDISEIDQTKGNEESQIVLIEYSDFQCPACSTYYNIMNQVMDEYGDDIYFSYRHFPLRSIHSNAQIAAQASEAAGVQGKFWEMHDKLFEGQNSWSNESNPEEMFVTYATELELDVEKFTTDLTSSTVKNKVDGDYTSGIGAKVNSTPSFFLNGEKISPKTLDDFKEIIEEELNSNTDIPVTTDTTE